MAITDMKSAIEDTIDDGDSVYLGGFTHLIPFAAGHEIIRQGYSDLWLIRATPDLIYDQMLAAGVASKITFSWAGNPGVGTLHAFRRAVEEGVPNEVSLDEYDHFGLTARLTAGAQNLPFVPVKTFRGSSLPEHNDDIRTTENPYTGEDVTVVPPLNPDVAIVRVQRASEAGDGQIWGISGEIAESAFAADTVILDAEEIVDESVIRSDPNRTVIPSTIVDQVVETPYGSHPSYAQGYYDRDNDAYLEWQEVSQTHEETKAWLNEWVYGVENRDEYMKKLGASRLLELEPSNSFAEPVNMGWYA